MHASLPVMCDKVLQPVHDLLLVRAGSHRLHVCEWFLRGVDVVPISSVPLLALDSQMHFIFLVDQKPAIYSAAVWEMITSLPEHQAHPIVFRLSDRLLFVSESTVCSSKCSFFWDRLMTAHTLWKVTNGTSELIFMTRWSTECHARTSLHSCIGTKEVRMPQTGCEGRARETQQAGRTESHSCLT